MLGKQYRVMHDRWVDSANVSKAFGSSFRSCLGRCEATRSLFSETCLGSAAESPAAEQVGSHPLTTRSLTSKLLKEGTLAKGTHSSPS